MRQNLAPDPSGGPSRPLRSLRAVGARMWVERSALIERLTATEAKLILIEAPAGYGKTVLVTQWRAHIAQARSFAWISLDEDDDEPGRLWRRIAYALLQACPELDAGQILRHLRGSSPDITGVLIPALVNELAALTVPAVLVLDDYHSISEPTCHEQMAFMVHHLPAAVQVVLVTRADPPLPLGRWRAAAEMAEFRAHELRFTAAEAGPVVSAVSGLEVTGSDLATLVERTEGWPTGLYLAALALRDRHEPGAFVRQFHGGSASIDDFLAGEVIGRQPAKIRRFLARTSVLSCFCAPLCEAVTGSPGAAEILATLERENAFIVPLDQSRQWFRYHHLFRQVLRGQLAGTGAGVVPVLHARASAWYQRSGLADEAIDHAIAAGDRMRATDLIAGVWYPYMTSGRTAAILGWLNRLGERPIGADPVAAHVAAWSAAASGDREAVRRWLPVMASSARARPLPNGMRSLESSVALLQGLFGFDGLGPMLRSAEKAAELESDVSLPWYALARMALGISRYLSGDAAGAEKPLREALASSAITLDQRLMSLSVLSLTLSELGQPTQARHEADRATSLMISGNLGRTPAAPLAHAAAGAAHAGLGRLREARSELEHALRLRRRVPSINVWATVDIMLLLTKVLIDLADRSSAIALAGEISRLLEAAPHDVYPLRVRLERLEQRLGGTSPALSLARPLTERELTVLRLLCSALSRGEIAATLGLSVNTIKTQVKSIYEKLGVSARGEAIARGQQLGIV